VHNIGEELLGLIFINVPTGDGLLHLQEARQKAGLT